MAREIKFRGKRLDNGEWVVGDLFHIAGGCLIFFGSDTDTIEPDIERRNPIAVEFFKDEIAVVDPDTVGQFTGLPDKDGKEIFEGDIIKLDFGRHSTTEIVWFRDGRFVNIDSVRLYHIETLVTFVKYATVIGNIHDNPELCQLPR